MSLDSFSLIAIPSAISQSCMLPFPTSGSQSVSVQSHANRKFDPTPKSLESRTKTINSKDSETFLETRQKLNLSQVAIDQNRVSRHVPISRTHRVPSFPVSSNNADKPNSNPEIRFSIRYGPGSSFDPKRLHYLKNEFITTHVHALFHQDPILTRRASTLRSKSWSPSG